MIIETAFTTPEAMDRVFDAISDLPGVLAELPAVTVNRVTEAAAARQIDGEVEIPVPGEPVTYRGSVLVAEADREAGSIHLLLEGRRPRHRAVTRVEAELRLRESGGRTIGSFQATARSSGRPETYDPDALRAAVAEVLEGLAGAVSRLVGGAAARSPAESATAERHEADVAATAPQPAAPAGPAVAAPETAARQPAPPVQRADAAPKAAAPEPAAPPESPPVAAAPQPVPVRPAASASTGPSAERTIPGRVELAPPAERAPTPRRPKPLGDLPGRDRRPWLIPAVLLGGLAIILLLIRRRRDD